jgi:hypothetical protein
MRIWLVPMSELDDKRIVAQHHEFHGIVNGILAGRKWKGWELPEHSRALEHLHDEIVHEFVERNFVHNWETHLHGDLMVRAQRANQARQVPYKFATPEALWEERWILVCRWDGVFKGRCAAPSVMEDYEDLIESYKEHGCLHNGPWEELSRDPETGARLELCLICKREKRSRGGKEAAAAGLGQDTEGGATT